MQSYIVHDSKMIKVIHYIKFQNNEDEVLYFTNDIVG